MDLTPDQIEAITSGVLQIIGALSIGAAVLPKPKSPAMIILRKVLDFGACNVGNAKNKQ